MFNNTRILAVIPARGGSKGIPKKNIKELDGRPLLSYSIAAGLRSSYIDATVVSTDSVEIAEIAKRFGAEVPFLRPDDLATDTSKTIDAVLHAIKTLALNDRHFEVVVLLQPTSPLRTEREVDAAIETFFSHRCLGLVSVSPVTENPILTRRIDQSGLLHPLLPISSTVRRQDMPTFWHVDGAIYINLISELSESTSLNDNPVAYIMPSNRSVDIDNLVDFKHAEEIHLELGDPLPVEVRPD